MGNLKAKRRKSAFKSGKTQEELGAGCPDPGRGTDRDVGGEQSPSRVERLIEDAGMHESLRGIIGRFTADAEMKQDLTQECLVCLWQGECGKLERTRSWYLQSCRFRVQHWLELGRSVDSPKRAKGERRIGLDGENDETVLGDYHTNGELFAEISCRDLVATLARHLAPREQVVLRGLADGLTLREVATEFALSYPTALKYRRKIAALVTKLAPRNEGAQMTGSRSAVTEKAPE
jgi:DNA-binding CsgD family transcriptional regulator